MICDVTYMYMTSYINHNMFQKSMRKRLSDVKHNKRQTLWGEMELNWAGAFSIPMCCIINAIHSLDLVSRLPLIAAIHVTMWLCGSSVSQSLPDDLSVSIHDVIFFFYIYIYLCSLILLLFYLKWSSTSTVQDIWHYLPLICLFITYRRRS